MYNCAEVLCDLTFAIVPGFSVAANKKSRPWAALFTAQFRSGRNTVDNVSETIPTLFILMNDRHRSTFKAAFEHVVARLALLFNYRLQKKNAYVKRIAAFDYEIAERDEYCKAFQIDVKKGCWMHLSGNIWQNFVKYGMKDALDYDKPGNRPFFHAYRKVKCLALLPLCEMENGWQLVRQELLDTVPHGFKGKLRSWIQDYFETYYIDGVYKLSDWNFYRDHDRTQGCIEVQHMIWHQSIGAHPLIWQFIEFLLREDALAQLRYEQIIANDGQTRWKRSSERTKEFHLTQLWDCLDHGRVSILQFLACASVAVSMKWKALDKLYETYGITYYIHSGDMELNYDSDNGCGSCCSE